MACSLSPRLPRFTTLRMRLTVLYAGFFTVGLIALALLVQGMIARTARATAAAELATSASVFDRLWQERDRALTSAADVVARDYGFRAAVASRDTATISSALASLRARVGVPLAVVVGDNGTVIGDAGALGDRIGSIVIAWDHPSAVVFAHGRAWRIVTAPVLAPLEIGRIAFIMPLDAANLHSLETLSAIPLTATMLARRAGDGWADATGTTVTLRPGAVAIVPTTAGPSFAMLRPLPGPGGAPQAALLLSYPLARAMAGYRSIQLGLVVAGLAWLALIVIGSGRLARGIARPIAALDAAARALEQGERAHVTVTTRDEVGRLATSFNAMARGIADREDRITHLAFHDPLTDLPNRAFFQQTLDQAIAAATRTGDQVSVLYLDLDGFKSVNDTLSHAVGDAMLRGVADVLVTLAGGAMVARLGGDEFAVVITEPDDRGAGRRLAQAIVDRLLAPLAVAGHQIAAGASIGIAMFPADGTTADTLVKHADLALYRAKQDGRGGYRFFEQALDDAARLRRQTETDLRTAIRTSQLDLHFQPIVTSTTGVICGFEALLRWPHPTRGLIGPADFIPIAEETGLILPLGEWVLHEACRVAAAWPDPIRVAVNVSPLQFRSSGFGAVVLQALAQSGLAPARLEIEITESVYLDGEAGVLQILHMLRGFGVRVALDDFGTGYSSLSYLRSFPFDKIKIDRSFVTNIADDASAAAIVKAIVDLAGALAMETTAEGVEDEEQCTQLRRQGCSTMQGFLFSRPVTAAAATSLLARSQPARRAA